MKNVRSNYLYLLMALLAGGLSSCKKELNLSPTGSLTTADVFSTTAGYEEALAKAYGAYALISSTGSTTSDISIAGVSDPAETDFLRQYWDAEELTTDEAVNAWNDPYLNQFHGLNWTSSNVYVTALYDRCLFQITVCNQLIAQSSDAMLTSRGITGASADSVREFKAEARFLRAFQYWVLMDLYGTPAFVTDKDPIGAGSFLPPQTTRAALFSYVESELQAVDSTLPAPHMNAYGRADQAAEWALLSRMYLNADTYLGSGNDHYTQAITYASKVINAGYSLMPSYQNLFLADNNLNNPEVILSINYDGVQTQNFGGTSYIINAALSAAQVPSDFGVPNGGWTGNRSTQSLPQFFPDYSGATDHRAIFNSTGQSLDASVVTTFTDGLAVTKWSNMTSLGLAAPSVNGELCSTDFPLFRLGEIYLNYAEAVLRGGSGGSMTLALQYFNDLRTRAYGNTSANVSTISLADILNERGRELYWEGFRRTDLIRFGEFTQGNYLWAWKGNVLGGTGVSANFNLFPIPQTELLSNPHLVQNPGF
jgi:hypothetical protein